MGFFCVKILQMIILHLTLQLMTLLSITPGGDDITGVWLTPDKESRIRISKTNNAYTGKVIWLLHPNDGQGKPLHDGHNPVASKRSRPIIGLEVLTVTPDMDAYSGKIYDAKTGKTYDATLVVNGDNLEIRIRVGLIRYKEIWARIS
jgi:uncharacterized protein (DUF2147 family)